MKVIKVGDVEVRFKGDRLLTERKDKQLKFSQSEFMQNPRSVLNSIINFLMKTIIINVKS